MTTYNNLAEDIHSYCALRSRRFTRLIPRFVRLAEDRMFDGGGSPDDPLYTIPVRVKEMAEPVIIRSIGGEAELPNGNIGLRNLSRPGDVGGLDYLAPDPFEAVRAQPRAGTTPSYYTVEGNKVRLAPSWNGDLRALVYLRPDGISVENPQNAIAEFYPSLYLFATLFEAFTFLRDGASAGAWFGRYRSAAGGVGMTAERTRHGGGRLRAVPRVAL